MNRKFNSTIFVLCVLVYGLGLDGCGGDTSFMPSPVPSFSQTPSPTTARVPSATVAITATPIFNNKTFVITPDALFSAPGLELLNTPNSKDFCAHIPPPEMVESADALSLLTGRFSLCPSRSRPLVNTAMDLDKGALVSVDNESADIVMEYAHVPIDGTISYYLQGLNNGHIDEIETNVLNYEYCESMLLSLDKNDLGILVIHNGALACVMTTENQIALIRVENIYPLDTQSVEFSFAILKDE